MKLKEEELRQLVCEVKDDFKKRQEERKPFEAQWQLNMNFVMGNQYCSIGYNNEVEDYEKQYFWQEREVFNHIATLVEIRLAKLQRVRPTMAVIPASGDESDIKTAKLSKKIINSIYNKSEMSKTIAEATKWSEITGSSFYKIVWNSDLGTTVGKINGETVKSGDIEISICTPFEIFPDNTNSEDIDKCQSIIHAKAYHVQQIKKIWGIDVEGEDINVFSLENSNSGLGGLGYNAQATKIISSVKKDHAIVIEKYELPSKEFPEGRLIIVSGDKVLYLGELPYMNRVDGLRGFPFVRQVSLEQNGCFWGASMVERVIPVQRAYNAIKNRKHEFINRLSMGILSVEDGSVDLDNLEEEGLSPGKILVYRQGSNAPHYLSNTNVPGDFANEEDRLMNEFVAISGVSDIMRSSASYSNISGVALQLLIEQDDSRLSISSDVIKEAIKAVAGQILRLYKQFASNKRLLKTVGDNGELELFYFNNSDISSDDIVFETDNELNETLAQRRSMVFDLLNAGLLQDENGKLSNRMRIKALDLLGFGVWENSQDLNELHMKKASSENMDFLKGESYEPSEIDDHMLHINEHIAFMLGSEYSKCKKSNQKIEKILLEHIRKHRQFNSLMQQLKNGEENGK